MARIRKTRMAKTGEDEDTVPATGDDAVVSPAGDIAADADAGEPAQVMARNVEESEAGASEDVVSGTGIDPVAASQPPAAGEHATGSAMDPAPVIVEAALAEEFEILDEFGKEGLEAVEEAANSLAGNFRKFAAETTSYSKEALDSRCAFAGELFRAKSLAAAIQIQIDFAKSAYVRRLAYLAKLSGLCWGLAGEAATRIEKAAAKAEG